jgi:hypothetical protein
MNIALYLVLRRSENMMQIINMFWIVVIFWLCIEVINYRINKNRKSAAATDDNSNDKQHY